MATISVLLSGFAGFVAAMVCLLAGSGFLMALAVWMGVGIVGATLALLAALAHPASPRPVTSAASQPG